MPGLVLPCLALLYLTLPYLVLQASHFNSDNGHWEPIVEPWPLEVLWAKASKADLQARGQGPGARDLQARGLGDQTSAQLHAQSLHIVAKQVLNVNVSHAMLISLVEVSRIVREARLRQAHQKVRHARHVELGEQLRTRQAQRSIDFDDVDAHTHMPASSSLASAQRSVSSPEAGDEPDGDETEPEADETDAEIKFMPSSVRNLTELPLRFATAHASSHVPSNVASRLANTPSHYRTFTPRVDGGGGDGRARGPDAAAVGRSHLVSCAGMRGMYVYIQSGTPLAAPIW